MPSLPPYSDPTLPERFLRWIQEVRDILRPIPRFYTADGSPEGVLTAEQGSRYYRTDGGAGTFLYVKTTTTGDTGWVAYA